MQVFVIALLVFGFTLISANRYKKKCYKNFEVDVRFNEVRMVEDQEFYYEVELRNKKFMILPIIKITLRVPSSFDTANVKRHNHADAPYSYTLTTSLFWYQKVKRKIKIVPHVRGFFDVETNITCMDVFGLVRIKYPETIKTRVMIHPKTIQIPYHAVSKAGLMGNDVVQRWINKDPLLYSGFREYTYTDSIKDIDWKLSAKSNELLVKNYDATSDPSIVFMYLGYKDENYHAKTVEFTISYLACLLKEMMVKKIPVAFTTNFVVKGKMKHSTGLECNQNHLIRVFDMLACLSYATGLDPVTFLMRQLPIWGQHHMFAIAIRKVDEDVAVILQKFAKLGYQIQLFVQEPVKYSLTNIEVHQLQSEVKDND